MKLRQKPEDFVVDEVSDLDIKDMGEFRLYQLKKREIETFYILNYLARKNNLPRDKIGIAGMKDKYAVTTQYFTVPSNLDIKTLKEKNFEIKFIGYVNKPLEKGDLVGNRFELIIRDLHKHEFDKIKQRAEELAKFGVPNYFDSQRFGSVIHNEFIAKKVLIEDYEGAVKIYLTHYAKTENKKRKDEKRLILENWKNLSKIRLNDKNFQDIIDTYLKTGKWLTAYRKIPVVLQEMFISAYQSHIWNECVKELIKRSIKKGTYAIRYNIGHLIYYKYLNEDEKASMPETFPLVSTRIKEEVQIETEILNIVLNKEGIEIRDFGRMAATGMHFIRHNRQVTIIPKDLFISDFSVDESNDKGKGNRFKVTVKFMLPKGSYATIITKKLFGH